VPLAAAILANPGRSIPTGTLGAIGTTTCIYLIAIWFFGTSLSNELLITDKLVVTAVAWPHELIVKVGIIMSCIGAGLQTMTGAPRLLAAIADDDAIPFLRPFAPATATSEPTRALMLTWIIASLPVLAGTLDFITPIITLFFLLMYAGINLCCFVLAILKAPGFRPTFKYFHWSLSLFGFVWCLGLGFVIDAYVTIVAIFLFVGLYAYIRTQGAVKEWGDSIRGLRYGLARDELLALNVKDNFHAKNWRPQILTFVETDGNGNPQNMSVLSVLSQMKKGRGLAMIMSLVKGDVLDKEVCEKAKDNRAILKVHMNQEEIKGFVEVLPTMNSTWSESIWDAVVHSGLGPMSPNSVLLAWPEKWADAGTMHKDVGAVSEKEFVKCLKGLTNLEKAILLFKGGAKYPCIKDRVEEGTTIDVWWVVHDGGLLLLMPHLINLHKVWYGRSSIRVYVVLTDKKENPVRVHASITEHLAKTRINATVITVDLSDTTIALDMRTLAQKTEKLTQRRGMLRELEDVEPEATLNAEEDFSSSKQKTGHKTVAEVFGGMFTSERSAKSGMAERTEAKDATDADITNTIDSKQEKRAKDEAKSRKIDESRMRTAVALNSVMLERSKNAGLVVCNLPLMRSVDHESDFCGYVEVMLEGLDSVLMVRGSGAEVVTTYG
jgi:potassium/chloride transporter 4/5/6